MAIKVIISNYLHKMTGYNSEMKVKGHNVLECLKNSVEENPALNEVFLDRNGKLQLGWFIYVNDKFINSESLVTPIEDGSKIGLYRIVAGG